MKAAGTAEQTDGLRAVAIDYRAQFRCNLVERLFGTDAIEAACSIALQGIAQARLCVVRGGCLQALVTDVALADGMIAITANADETAVVDAEHSAAPGNTQTAERFCLMHDDTSQEKLLCRFLCVFRYQQFAHQRHKRNPGSHAAVAAIVCAIDIGRLIGG